MPILRYLRKNLNAKRFSEYVSNHLSTLKINKKITALLKCGYQLIILQKILLNYYSAAASFLSLAFLFSELRFL